MGRGVIRFIRRKNQEMGREKGICVTISRIILQAKAYAHEMNIENFTGHPCVKMGS
jgi:hypothetical protein